MNFISISFLVVQLCVLSTSTLRDADGSSPAPICIIGGGVTGLTLANLLQDRGHFVHLYEAESRFGGKISTFRSQSGSPHPIQIEQGPVLFSHLTRNVLKYLKKYNLTTIPFSNAAPLLLNPETGQVFPNVDIFLEELASGIEKYVVAYNTATNNSTALTSGYFDLTPDQIRDLSAPIQTWLEAGNMSELTQFFSAMLTTLGYGDVKDTPALYALKMVPGDRATVYFGGNSLTVKEGFDVLMERMGASVPNKFVGWRATQISRSFGGEDNKTQEILFSVPGRSIRASVTCSKTILAFPPLLRNLIGLLPDLRHNETEILNQVKVIKYTSAGVEIPVLKRDLYAGLVPQLDMDEETGALLPSVILPPGDGGVVLLGKALQAKNDSIYTAYSWIYGDYSDQADEGDVQFMERKLNETLTKIDPTHKILFKPRPTQYFPHVTGASIRGGFYKDFNALQGEGGVYFATTLLSFECIDTAIEMAEDFVEKYF